MWEYEEFVPVRKSLSKRKDSEISKKAISKLLLRDRRAMRKTSQRRAFVSSQIYVYTINISFNIT
jgi:hypothetical protein